MPLPHVLRQRKTWLIAIPVLILLVAVVGPFVYIQFIQGDPPEKLVLSEVTTTTGAPGATTTTGGSTASDGIDGTYSATDGSTAGYRVGEVLFGQDAEATGRTTAVTGTMTIAGTTVSEASFEVDMASIASDQSRRDGQFHGRIMETSTYPTATFELTEPIELDAVPANGEQISVEATGDLTVKDVTQSVTFTLKAQRNGANIELNGTIPTPFADYGIDDPSGGPATVKDNAVMEFLIVLAPA